MQINLFGTNMFYQLVKTENTNVTSLVPNLFFLFLCFYNYFYTFYVLYVVCEPLTEDNFLSLSDRQ